MSSLWDCLTSCFRPPNPAGYRPLVAKSAAPVLNKWVELTKKNTKSSERIGFFDENNCMSKILGLAGCQVMANKMVLVCKAWRFRVVQFCTQQCKLNNFPPVQRKMKDFTSEAEITVSCYVKSYAVWCQCAKTAFDPNAWQEYLVSKVFGSEEAVLPKEEVDAFYSLPVNQRGEARLIFVPMRVRWPETNSRALLSGLSLRMLGMLSGLPSPANATKKKFPIQYNDLSFASQCVPMPDKKGNLDGFLNLTNIWPDRWLGDQTKKPLWIIATPKTQSLIRQVLLNFTEFVRTGRCFCDKENGTRVKDPTLSESWNRYSVHLMEPKKIPSLLVLTNWPMTGLRFIPPSP